MEVYVLDANLRRVVVIDRFESLIWTERFNDLGDFKLVVFPTTELRNNLIENAVLAMSDSHRIMVVENTELKTDETGKKTLVATGRSYEMLLEKRVAAEGLDPLNTTPTWNITDAPADIARYIFDQICVQGRLNNKDIIPFVTTGTLFPADTIPEPTDEVSLKIPPKTVLKAIKDICDLHGFGFRLVRDPAGGALYFHVYTGSDRSTLQTVNSPVVFSDKLDNLTNTTELTSVEEAYDCAYVFSPIGSKLVFPSDDSDDEAVGLARKVMLIEASDLTSSSDIPGDLTAIGREALSAQKPFKAFDGEINEYSQYKYGVDYQLGDLIELANSDGGLNIMRVTEQIFSSDATGDRSYPTLTINLAVTPGSWLSWPINDEWVDFTTEVWSELP